MKTCFRFWSLGLGLLAVGPAPGAEPLPWPNDAAPAESALKKSTRLIREKAGLPQVPHEVGPPASAVPPAEPSPDTVVLEPFVVTEKKPPAIPPPLHETRVQEFFRTGTLWKKIGHTFTREFWVRGDQGIGFTLSW